MRRAVVLGAAAALALAGCGGGGGDEAPRALGAGLQALQTDLFRIGRPAAWTVETRPSPDGIEGATLSNVVGPPLANGAQPELVVVATPGYSSSIDDAASLADESAQFRDGRRRVLSRKDIDVPGAEAARRIDADVPGKDGKPVRITTVFAMSESRLLLNVAVFVPVAELPRVPVEAIVQSLQVRG